MATKLSNKTTFRAARTIEPVYTGGEISVNVDGSLLATSVDGDVQIVDVRSGKSLVRIDGDGESVTSLAISPASSHLVICSRSLSMKIFALSQNGTTITAELLRTLKPHTSPVVSSTIDSTGSLLVTGGADGVAKVWDIRGGYCSHTFHGHGGLVTATTIFESDITSMQRGLSNGKKRKSRNEDDTTFGDTNTKSTMLLATGGEDGKIKIWDLNTRKNIATLDSHTSVVRSIEHSSAQNLLCSASRDRTIVIWSTEKWQPQRIIPTLEVLEAGGFIAAGRYCYGGGENGRLRVWNVKTGKEVTERQQPGLETETIVTILELRTEKALLTIHQDQTMTAHSYDSLEDPVTDTVPSLPILRRISGNLDEVIDMACVGPERLHLALATNTESVKIISIKGNSDSLSTPAFGSDIAMLEGHQDIIICMDVDWSGHWLATGAKDNTARLWRMDPAQSLYECVATFAGHAESLGAIALPRGPPTDGSAVKDPLNHPPAYLITGSQDKTIKRWDTSKLKVSHRNAELQNVAKAVYTRVAHEKDINAIDVSPIAPLFASASQDRTIKIWSLEDGATTGILRGHKRGVWSIRFSPAGMAPINLSEGGKSSSRGLLISGSGDRSVKVWSLTTYTCLSTFEGHSNSVLKVIWLPPPGSKEILDDSEPQRAVSNQNQPIIASASSDTLIKLWTPYASPDSDHLLTTLDNHTDRVWSLTSLVPPIPAHPDATHASSKNRPSQQRQPYTFISGAADATLTFWTDTTTQTQLSSMRAQTQRIEQDQMLQNHINARDYRSSIILALQLNHPARLFTIFSSVINLPEVEKEPGSLTGVHAVDDVLGTLSQADLYLLLCRIRDWNVNARSSPVAQRVLHVLFKKHPRSTWVEMARNRDLARSASRRATIAAADADADDNNNDEESQDTTNTTTTGRKPAMSMRDLFRALEVYTERHYRRMQELVDESYLLEYTLREMDEVAGTLAVDVVGDNGNNNGNGNGTKARDGRTGTTAVDDMLLTGIGAKSAQKVIEGMKKGGWLDGGGGEEQDVLMVDE